MIVDELRAVPAFRRLTAGAQVIRVPFAVFPLDRTENVLVYEDGEQLRRTCPMHKDRNESDTTWWRPPFERMIITSETREIGVLVALDVTKEYRVSHESHADTGWAYVLALVQRDSHEGIGIASAGTIAQVGDTCEYFDEPQSRASAITWTYQQTGTLPIGYTSYEHLYTSIKTIAAKLTRTSPLSRSLMLFSTVCALLACKNVAGVDVHPPAKLQRARQQRGLLPLVSFKTLVIKTGGRARGSTGVTGEGEPLALHWVRGHFKTYTAEKPLLGRAVGTYWWSPHLAGQADRVVVKDYKLEE